MRHAALVLLGLLVLLDLPAACGGPNVQDGEIVCGIAPDPICPPGFSCAGDGRCYRHPPGSAAVCGDGVVEGAETCDPPSSCPTSCHSDGNDCTTETLRGDASTCNVSCSSTPIASCSTGDACCPTGCSFASDGDCSALCGNGVVDPNETCDPVATCPSSCDDGNSCTADSMTGSVANCNVACSHDPVVACASGDGCCPVGCTSLTDLDCSAQCGNGVVDPNETCDPPASCPSCDDGIACTLDTRTGSAANCNVSCGHTSIVSCENGDGCCPPGCSLASDHDCSASCGDGVLDAGETCDPPSTCPSTCNDGNACTVDSTAGSAASCNLSCGHTGITTCGPNDGCCPAGCTNASDGNCSSMCGNGVLDMGETCDPPSTCTMIAMMCNDLNACTFDVVTGAPATCNVVCSHSPVSQCLGGDSCCPPGCSGFNDSDCGPVTGCPDGGMPVPGDAGLGCGAPPP